MMSQRAPQKNSAWHRITDAQFTAFFKQRHRLVIFYILHIANVRYICISCVAVEIHSRLRSAVTPVYDAAAKLPSGLLSGNINQLGNFDQCLSVHSAAHSAPRSSVHGQTTEDPVRGKYCLAYMQPIEPPNPMSAASLSSLSPSRLQRLHGLIQSHGAFRSDFDDVSINSKADM